MKNKILKELSIILLAATLSTGCSNTSANASTSKSQPQGSPSVSDVLEKKASEESSQIAVTSPEPSILSSDEANFYESPSDDASFTVTDDINTTQESNTSDIAYDTEPDPDVDIDLTAMSSTMVYSEVYQMCYYPEEYIGKTVKMDGMYSFFYDSESGNSYYACIISDATACCAQGIEFKLLDEQYPPEDTEYVAVKGVFDLYEEDGVNYCTLKDAELLASS